MPRRRDKKACLISPVSNKAATADRFDHRWADFDGPRMFLMRATTVRRLSPPTPAMMPRHADDYSRKRPRANFCAAAAGLHDAER